MEIITKEKLVELSAGATAVRVKPEVIAAKVSTYLNSESFKAVDDKGKDISIKRHDLKGKIASFTLEELAGVKNLSNKNGAVILPLISSENVEVKGWIRAKSANSKGTLVVRPVALAVEFK